MLASKDKKSLYVFSPLRTIYTKMCCVSNKLLQPVDENQDSAEKQEQKQ